MRIRHSVLAVVLGAALLGLAGCNRVDSDWKTAQAADTTEAYQQFLQQHQDSEFATQAQARMRQLAEDREWQAASGQDTKEAYEQFLAQHADSKWAQEAHARLDNFQQATAASPAAAEPAEATADPAVVANAPESVTAPPAAAPAVPVAEARPKQSASTATAKPAAKNTVAKKPAPAKQADKPLRVASVSGMRYAQLGAFSSRERAEQEWKSLQSKLGAELGSLKPHYSTAKSGSQLRYRLQVGPSTPQQVADLCAKLRKHAQACIPARG